jgi:arabinofuranosyltransferase
MRRILLAPLLLAATTLLLSFAHWFDFQCDDAFIAFRYADNWVHHGQIVYNLGERVEGYTSFTWVSLLAGLHACGLELPTAAKLLGAASGFLLVVLTAQFGQRLFPTQPFGTVALLAMVAGNACVAAWTLGGLETPLFAALVVGSLSAYLAWIDRPTAGRAAAAAACLAAATLTRPEGGLLFFACLLALGTLAWSTRRLPRGSAVFALVYLLSFGGYLLWRRSYYGDLLPNVFYVKTTGSGAALRAQGLSYLGFFVEEFGVVLAIGLLLLVLLPARGQTRSQWGPRAARVAVQAFTLSMLGYVMAIGGDFLDLYRFLVPTLPLVFAIALHSLLGLLDGVPLLGTGSRIHRLRWIQPIVGVVCLLWYASHQVALAERAMQLSEPGRKAFGIEPLGWTATYARRWAATGRWIQAQSKPGDTLAVGAAGAMPFYAQLPNIDTFGLCDAYVARHGIVIGSRPGHQRFAPIDYLLRRAPTFLLVNDYAADDPESFRREPSWEQLGYLWVEAEIRPDIHRAPSAFFHYMLVRRDRATELRGHPWTRVADQGSF